MVNYKYLALYQIPTVFSYSFFMSHCPSIQLPSKDMLRLSAFNSRVHCYSVFCTLLMRKGVWYLWKNSCFVQGIFKTTDKPLSNWKDSSVHNSIFKMVINILASKILAASASLHIDLLFIWKGLASPDYNREMSL